MSTQPVLIGGRWREASSKTTFQATNPATTELLPEIYPVSEWSDCDEALDAACCAHADLCRRDPESIAQFLEAYATEIESRADELVAAAHQETALPVSPRLADGELPRTTGQLRQAAAAARQGSWSQPTIDTAGGIRSFFASLGPICVFGPNNFPFAFGSISGGDFAAAIAAGNPVIAKAHSSHPKTTRFFAECAYAAAEKTDMPPAIIQLIYRTSHADGERLVSDPRIGATGYTGGRTAGLVIKQAADRAGKPVYLELSSVNPVVILPGALRQRGDEIVGEFVSSCLMGTGQFCTNPGLIVLIDGDDAGQFISEATKRFTDAPVGTLLSEGVGKLISQNLSVLTSAGGELLTGGTVGGGAGFCHANTLLRVSAEQFLADPETWQTEVFGNVSLIVVAADTEQAHDVLQRLEGNLTGCIYSDSEGSDDDDYDQLAPALRHRVGRLINDNMPTGVAVSPAMNHGGPYPATGHPGYTAVGIPAALLRFAMLQCFDHVRDDRLPLALRDKSPNGEMWRSIDGHWTQADVT